MSIGNRTFFEFFLAKMRKNQERRAFPSLSFYTQQAEDRGIKRVGQILQLVVRDDAVAGFDPADGLLRDVEPRDLDLVGELLLR